MSSRRTVYHSRKRQVRENRRTVRDMTDEKIRASIAAYEAELARLDHLPDKANALRSECAAALNPKKDGQ